MGGESGPSLTYRTWFLSSSVQVSLCIARASLSWLQDVRSRMLSLAYCSQVVAAERHSGDLLTNRGHQIVSDTFKKVRSTHTAMANTTGDGKPVEVSAFDADTALCVAVKQFDNLRW